MKLCKCGCRKKVKSGQTYINGHNRKGKKHKASVKESLRKQRVSYLRDQIDESKPHRLSFPKKKRSESQGEFYFKKFEYFCKSYVAHVQGRFFGKPVILMNWQREILKKLFTLDESGKRKYTRLLVHVPRKNGKTFLAALLILYWLSEESFSDMGAEVISCANTREQSSKTIFRTCRLMVQYSKELDRLIKIGNVPAMLSNRLTHASYEPLAADSKPQLGRNISLVVFDETLGQPNGDLWDVMSTSQGMREQPLFVSISTAGDTRASFYYGIYEKMKEILADPTIDPHTLVSIYECPEEWDWRDPKSFIIANPALSHDEEEGFRSETELKHHLKAALSGEGINGYRQYYLNQWAKVGMKRLVGLDKWDLCKGEIDFDSLKDAEVWVGVDLSQTTDLTGVAVIIAPTPTSPKWKILNFAWLAGETLSECSRRDRLPYEKWVNEEIIYFDGKLTIDPKSILDILFRLRTLFPKLETIAHDPYAETLLAEWGKHFKLQVIPQQAIFVSPSIKSLQIQILNQNIIHEGNPLMRAMLENARVHEDGKGNLSLDKGKSTSRIDCLQALITGIALIIKEKGGFK